MNLYVWHGVLRDYTPGMVVALASSLKEAREIVVRDFVKSYSSGWPKKQKVLKEAYLAEKEAFIRAEISGSPEVIRKPESRWIYGGG